MTDKAVSALTSLTGANTATGDLLYIVDISEAAAADRSKKITVGDLHVSIPNGTNSAPSIAFASDPNTGIFRAGADSLGFAVGGTQAMTLDASGNLGVGETSPDTRAHIYGANTAGRGQLYIQGSGTVSRFVMANSSDAQALSTYGDSSTSLVTWDAGSGYSFRWTVADAERARITSGGYFKASNAGTYVETTNSHELRTTEDARSVIISATNASYTSDITQIRASRNTTNNSFYALTYYNDGATAYKFQIADSGNATNTNNSYGAISDQKLKQDIVDAGSQWGDIKGLRVRKFRYKADPTGPLQLGLVAQEAETVSPGLIEEHPDFEEVEVAAIGEDGQLLLNEDGSPQMTKERRSLGTTTKAVKYSILYMKAVKALQEAMTRIEQLEAKVAALEAK